MWLLIRFTAVMITLTVAALAAITLLYAHGMATDRRHLVPPPAPAVEPRPQCPWCDTRECLDSTLCNCAEPCGSWLCVDKEASRG